MTLMTDHVEDLGERYSHFDEDSTWGVVHWPHLPGDIQDDNDDDDAAAADDDGDDDDVGDHGDHDLDHDDHDHDHDDELVGFAIKQRKG